MRSSYWSLVDVSIIWILWLALQMAAGNGCCCCWVAGQIQAIDLPPVAADTFIKDDRWNTFPTTYHDPSLRLLFRAIPALYKWNPKESEKWSQFIAVDSSKVNLFTRRLVLTNLTISGNRQHPNVRVGQVEVDFHSYVCPELQVRLQDVDVCIDFTNIFLTRSNWHDLIDLLCTKNLDHRPCPAIWSWVSSVQLAGNLTTVVRSQPLDRELASLRRSLNNESTVASHPQSLFLQRLPVDETNATLQVFTQLTPYAVNKALDVLVPTSVQDVRVSVEQLHRLISSVLHCAFGYILAASRKTSGDVVSQLFQQVDDWSLQERIKRSGVVELVPFQTVYNFKENLLSQQLFGTFLISLPLYSLAEVRNWNNRMALGERVVAVLLFLEKSFRNIPSYTQYVLGSSGGGGAAADNNDISPWKALWRLAPTELVGHVVDDTLAAVTVPLETALHVQSFLQGKIYEVLEETKLGGHLAVLVHDSQGMMNRFAVRPLLQLVRGVTGLPFFHGGPVFARKRENLSRFVQATSNLAGTLQRSTVEKAKNVKLLGRTVCNVGTMTTLQDRMCTLAHPDDAAFNFWEFSCERSSAPRKAWIDIQRSLGGTLHRIRIIPTTVHSFVGATLDMVAPVERLDKTICTLPGAVSTGVVVLAYEIPKSVIGGTIQRINDVPVIGLLHNARTVHERLGSVRKLTYAVASAPVEACMGLLQHSVGEPIHCTVNIAPIYGRVGSKVRAVPPQISYLWELTCEKSTSPLTTLTDVSNFVTDTIHRVGICPARGIADKTVQIVTPALGNLWEVSYATSCSSLTRIREVPNRIGGSIYTVGVAPAKGLMESTYGILAPRERLGKLWGVTRDKTFEISTSFLEFTVTKLPFHHFKES